MRFFHPLFWLRVPKTKTNNSISADLLKSFQANNWRNIYNVFLRAQNAQPIRQHDVDAADTMMRCMARQRLSEQAALIKSLGQEIEDLIDQLSEPFETEKPDTPLLEKAFSTYETIQKLRGKNEKQT